MKTFEEKAVAYEKALEFVKGWYNDSSTTKKEKLMLELAFHELKESDEDERIRKELISHFNGYKSNCGSDWYGIKVDSIIAWLEKQVEQNPQGKSALEAVKEEKVDNQNCVKPADKVEPKFKVGDWVVRGKTIAQILDIQEQYYVGLDINGNDFTSSRFLSDDKIHLWTIQDAKDGDVLVTREKKQPFIFKKYDEDTDYVYAYCGISDLIKDNSFYSDDDQLWTCYSIAGDVYPATKEQSNLLFKKMREAGYEWDDEKKELKKTDEEFNGEDYGIDSLYHAQRILEKTLGSVDGYQSDDGILEHKCAISAVKKLSKKSVK